MYGNEFQALSFPKRGKEIVSKAKVKADANKLLIDEKESEIQRMAKEHNLDVLKLMTNLDLLRGHSSQGIPSAEMEKMKALASRVDELKKENERLSLIVRNLPEGTEFNLSFEELRYFDF